MYSFEGDFRRKPQQNLAGASSRQNMSRDALLLKAQQERLKREDQRKRLNSTIKIQAYVRSFLTRIRCKKYERTQFDASLSPATIPDELQLVVLIRRLLFFYDQPKDSSRLIFISQQLLKKWTKVLKDSGSYLQIRRLLALHLKLLNNNSKGRDSMAVPLRMLEVFTSTDSATAIMDRDTASHEISATFLYLIKRGYFREIRLVLQQKTPSLYGPSASPPTPLAASLFDLMQRPFLFVDESNIPEYSHTVMFEFASSILSCEMSEVIRMFVMPALCAQSSFPYASLVWCLGSPQALQSDLHYSSWLLYSVLLLQPQNFVQSVCGPQKSRVNITNYFSNPQILNYLAVMARLTSILCIRHRTPSDAFYARARNTQAGAESEGSSDTEEELPPGGNVFDVNKQCIEMLNNTNSAILFICSQTGQCDWNEDVLEHISGICHNLLLSHKLAFHKYKLLFTLAFKPSFLRALWSWSSNLEISSSASPSTSHGVSVTGAGGSPGATGRGGTLLAMLAQGMGSKAARLLAPLATFCSLYSLLLTTLHDEEFGQSDTAPVTGESNTSIVSTVQAFSFSELGPLCVLLRQVCTGLIELAFPEQRLNVGQDYRSAVFASTATEQDKAYNDRYPNLTAIWAHLFKVAVRLLRQLHMRDQRLYFTSGERDWCGGGGGLALPLLAERPHQLLHPRRHQRLRLYRPFAAFTALTREDCEEGPPLTTKEVRTLTILKEIPFVVPFSQRVLIFQGLLMRDKQEHQGDLVSFLQGPNIHVMIRRSHIYEDAFDKLSPQNEPDLRLKMRVQLMNEAGLEEAGVDGGGVFREFLSELLRTACDPNRGFFRLTRDNTLYPNPAVHLLVDNFQQHYYFIGRMLGKALYEGLLVDLPLAEFFLQALVGGESGGEADIHRLAALDERLHRSLLQLRALPPAAVPDLGLDFTVMTDELGEQKVDELKPGGANIAVTAGNRIEYIHLMAEWKLSRQVRLQTAAARRGLAGVVPLAWLRLFGPKELRLLVSGAESGVDVEDLKQHTNYGGGYTLEHPTIQFFWKALEEFTDIQKRQLLKFVTSCSRPPLLGFKDLDPPFCIQHAGTSERLPSASTCMNLLKLPEFPSEAMLKEKLLYAINAGAGFELS